MGQSYIRRADVAGRQKLFHGLFRGHELFLVLRLNVHQVILLFPAAQPSFDIS
jgi:hypothetical protein